MQSKVNLKEQRTCGAGWRSSKDVTLSKVALYRMCMNTYFIFASVGGFAGGAAFLFIIALWAILLLGMWKVFAKGGQPGWACIVPVYNVYCLIKIAGKEWWWLLLCLVPVVNFVVAIMLLVAVSRNFGKGGGFAAGLIFLPWIFYPILGFGAARYQTPTQPAAA
jgi:hypothetical protein